jgi:hypothetical protein
VSTTSQAEGFAVVEETAVPKGIRRVSGVTQEAAVQVRRAGKPLSFLSWYTVRWWVCVYAIVMLSLIAEAPRSGHDWQEYYAVFKKPMLAWSLVNQCRGRGSVVDMLYRVIGKELSRPVQELESLKAAELEEKQGRGTTTGEGLCMHTPEQATYSTKL